jgi:hypothetical protein
MAINWSERSSPPLEFPSIYIYICAAVHISYDQDVMGYDSNRTLTLLYFDRDSMYACSGSRIFLLEQDNEKADVSCQLQHPAATELRQRLITANSATLKDCPQSTRRCIIAKYKANHHHSFGHSLRTIKSKRSHPSKRTVVNNSRLSKCQRHLVNSPSQQRQSWIPGSKAQSVSTHGSISPDILI